MMLEVVKMVHDNRLGNYDQGRVPFSRESEKPEYCRCLLHLMFFHCNKKTGRVWHAKSTDAFVSEAAPIAHVVAKEKFAGAQTAIVGGE